jgi:two-component system, NtrC family, sensor kinase
MLETPYRNNDHKKFIWLILIAAFGFLLSAVALGLWHSAEVRNIVARQFNEEQLVIAQNVASLIERELVFLEKEITILSTEAIQDPDNPGRLQSRIQNSLSRIIESGATKIMIIHSNPNNAEDGIHHYSKDDYWVTANNTGSKRPGFPTPGEIPPKSAWFSHPDTNNSEITMFMAAPLPAPEQGLIVFEINVSWLLNPFLKDIRSGKTGYAWIIDNRGYFLFHPEKDFIGRDAFDARQRKDPQISFHTINFIQKEKMLTGMVGTGSYESGWHRGMTGLIEKFVAYAPIRVSEHFPQKWSIAVTAPVLEIEGLVQKAHNRQMLLQLLILAAIVAAASAVLLFERRWSRFLELEVNERTQALRRSEEKYRSLVESAEDFIFTVDKKGHFLSVNPFAASTFGKNPSDCIKMPLSSLFPPLAAEKMHHLSGQVFQEAKSVRDNLEIVERDRRTWINANFMPLKDKKGRVGAVLCIARDITDQKNLESRLVNAEKLASLGTLAAGVAHEINNPIGVILGFSDLLLQDAPPESQEWEDLKTIERQGLHCKQIVENLLSFARHGKENTDHTDINECIEEVVKIVNHTLEMNDIELDMNIAEHLPPVYGDFRQLQQVFLNLVNNATSAMPYGGKLVISGFMNETSDKVVVSLSDTGTGIPEKDISHIFEPFFTTKPEGEGTGLGLFVSYGIISRYGGTIECESQTDEISNHPGTTFTITFYPAPERTNHAENTDPR